MRFLFRMLRHLWPFGRCSSTMQATPLLVTNFLDHAARHHAEQTIVTAHADGSTSSLTYRQLQQRSKALMLALEHEGLRYGEVVGTLAWNTARHMEVYYGVMGRGAVCHTLNPRLHPETLAAIMKHAGDTMLIVEAMFIPVLEKMAAQLPRLRCIIVMVAASEMPQSTVLRNLLCYEDLVTAQLPHVKARDVPWRVRDESAACAMCYTSGTTGEPKGVAYSHRSQVLHAYGANLPDFCGIRSMDTVLVVVPMFHVNAWGLPFIGPMAGARLVLPGSCLAPKALHALLTGQRVTFTAAVPTIWTMLLEYLRSDSTLSLEHLRRVVVGGSAITPVLIHGFEDEYKVSVVQGWGMTETSPIGTFSSEKAGLPFSEMTSEARLAYTLKQGRVCPVMDMKIIGEDGKDLPWDGTSFGRLVVKGPCCTERYHKTASVLDRDGWFDTGDVATINSAGCMQIVDRSKDLIKSGGEWISSQKLEQLACGVKGVALAAAIAVPDAKWGERPLLLVQPATGEPCSKDSILANIAAHAPKWWLPADVVQVESLPLGATGKVDKSKLRVTYGNWRPTVSS